MQVFMFLNSGMKKEIVDFFFQRYSLGPTKLGKSFTLLELKPEKNQKNWLGLLLTTLEPVF